MKHQVRLSQKEMLQAAMVGVVRQIENIGKKRTPAYGSGSENDWQLHIEGAMGEMAFAKLIEKYWSGANEFRADDVGPWMVRTRSKDWYELTIHDEDVDTKRYVLVTGKNGIYTVHGWVLGSEGKNKIWWKDPAGGRPAYFVPQAALKPVELVELVFDIK